MTEARGWHLIAGDRIDGEAKFQNMPTSGTARTFPVGTPKHVDQAVHAAEDAFPAFTALHRAARARLLRSIAEEIEARRDAITEAGTDETGLPTARLEGERGRTTRQLRLFADHIETGDHLDRRHDAAEPDRSPLPRPDLRMIQRPLGPVAVFGASNFPLAFSVAGGDTASALAAGCPVVVKGHEAHPSTGQIVAEAIAAATDRSGVPAGVFSMIHGGAKETGQALVRHPLIRAVGFTGSLRAGRALYDLCAARPEPIPFFGELGSVNPVFVLGAALAARGEDIARGWAQSLSMGVGQFCTNPGILVLPEGPNADAFVEAAAGALSDFNAQTMLTDRIAETYRDDQAGIARAEGVVEVMASPGEGRSVGPGLYRTDAETFLADAGLREEVFGPLGMIVTVRDSQQTKAVARAIDGQLTCTLHLDPDDIDDARPLVPILERKAGRLLANGFPTGVEVAHAMVHGGPYPASTNFGHTSVGTLAIRRWLRPVCYQDMPSELLPADLT